MSSTVLSHSIYLIKCFELYLRTDKTWQFNTDAWEKLQESKVHIRNEVWKDMKNLGRLV